MFVSCLDTGFVNFNVDIRLYQLLTDHNALSHRAQSSEYFTWLYFCCPLVVALTQAQVETCHVQNKNYDVDSYKK